MHRRLADRQSERRSRAPVEPHRGPVPASTYHGVAARFIAWG